MISYFVRYRGTSSDPNGFRDYYETRHARILCEFTNIRSLVLHEPTEWVDPFPVQPGKTLLLAQMVFENTNALNTALKSDARRRARSDFHLFPEFAGAITHEAMSGKVVF